MRQFFIALVVFTIGSSDKPNINSLPIEYGLKEGDSVPDIILTDTLGRNVRLSSFKGKIIYLNFWTPTCTPCLKLFPYDKTLIEQLQLLRIDSNILIIKICADAKTDQWKSIIHKYNSPAINLLLPGKDYKIWRRFKLNYYSTYQIIGRDFKYLGTEVSKPDDPKTAYYLLRALQNISYSKAEKEMEDFSSRVQNGDSSLVRDFIKWRNSQ
jgi:hypothetical protein